MFEGATEQFHVYLHHSLQTTTLNCNKTYTRYLNTHRYTTHMCNKSTQKVHKTSFSVIFSLKKFWCVLSDIKACCNLDNANTIFKVLLQS